MSLGLLETGLPARSSWDQVGSCSGGVAVQSGAHSPLQPWRTRCPESPASRQDQVLQDVTIGDASSPGPTGAGRRGSQTPQRATLELPIERRSPPSCRTAASSTPGSGQRRPAYASGRRPLAPMNSAASSAAGAEAGEGRQRPLSPVPLMRSLANINLNQLMGLPSPARAGVSRGAASFEVAIPSRSAVGECDAKRAQRVPQAQQTVPAGSPVTQTPSSGGRSLIPNLGSPGPLSSPLGFSDVPGSFNCMERL